MEASTLIEIIEEAIRSVAKVGFQKTNARSIAKHLGMQPSNVFYYFGKQKDLYDAMINYIVGVNRDRVAAKLFNRSTSLEKLHAYVEGNLEWAGEYPAQVATLLYGFISVTHDEYLKQLVQSALQNVGEVSFLQGFDKLCLKAS